MNRRKNCRGYYEVKCPGHPFCDNKGYVREHRLVLEEHLRVNEPEHPALIEIHGVKYLRKEYEPDHLNLNKLDNRIENLNVMLHDEHARLHILLRELAKETSSERKKTLKNNIIKMIADLD